MIQELDLVVLLHDVDQLGLQRGDVGTVVHAYTSGPAYEVEFVTPDGDTVGVVTLMEGEIRLRKGKELLHVRDLAGAERRCGQDGHTNQGSDDNSRRTTRRGTAEPDLEGL